MTILDCSLRGTASISRRAKAGLSRDQGVDEFGVNRQPVGQAGDLDDAAGVLGV